MPKKRFSAEQIIVKLREVEVLQGQGTSIQDAARQLDITEQTYYRWRKSYGGMRTDQARRLKELEKENARLKKLVGEQALEMAILKEARDFLSKNC
jgi:putative transposase